MVIDYHFKGSKTLNQYFSWTSSYESIISRRKQKNDLLADMVSIYVMPF